MNAQKLHEGALDLYRLMLAYEENQQQIAAQTPREDVLASNAWLETEDEPTDPVTQDWLLNDAVARLRERGVRVRPGEDEIAFIALAPQQLIHTESEQERLSRTGWNYVTLNTLEVFADPEAVVARILRYLGVYAD